MALSIEKLNSLTPEEMADKTIEELELEFGDGQPSDLDNDDDDQNQDEQEDDNPNDDDEEGNEDNPEEQEEESEQDQEQEQEGLDKETDPNKEQEEEEGSEEDPKKQVKSKDKATVDPNADLHKSFYEAMTKPFTANGQQYSLTDPNDFISLVQKGLNYNLKMNTIKPFMAAGTLLQQHDLLDTEKLAFLIDLHNKKPEAIAKLIKDTGQDAYEFDEEKANNYTATPVNIPSEEAIALKDVIASNKDNPDFSAVYDAATKWDDDSQDILLKNPALLETLTLHKANGVYDKIMQEVNVAINVRGSKTPVIELYHAIGLNMFSGNKANTAQAHNNTETKKTVVTKQVDPRIEEKRKALKSVKTSQGKSVTNTQDMTEEDIYRLSPEEFAKIDQRFLKGK